MIEKQNFLEEQNYYLYLYILYGVDKKGREIFGNFEATKNVIIRFNQKMVLTFT